MNDPRDPGDASARLPHTVPTTVVSGDLDLTGVDPLRIAEVRRRVAAVKEYIVIAEPDDGDRRRHARLLGLSVNQFLALVRAWREHGRAAAISGSGATRGAPRARVPRSLPAPSRDAAMAVISGLEPDVPHVDAVRAVEARCAALGVRAPSRSTIWNMVMAARRDAAQVAGDATGVIVSLCHARLPVERKDGPAYPWIVMAVDLADGVVLAAAMDDELAVASVLRRGLSGALSAGEVSMGVDVAALIGNGEGPPHTTIKANAARTATARALGRGIGSVELIYQLRRAARPERMLKGPKDSALRPADARSIVEEQLATHNAARDSPPPAVSWA